MKNGVMDCNEAIEKIADKYRIDEKPDTPPEKYSSQQMAVMYLYGLREYNEADLLSIDLYSNKTVVLTISPKEEDKKLRVTFRPEQTIEFSEMRSFGEFLEDVKSGNDGGLLGNTYF